MKRYRKIAIFYRNSLPAALEIFVNSQKETKILKDGVFTYNGVRCPRATISIEWSETQQDKDKLSGLVRLLEELESNNQIVAFSLKVSQN